MLPESDWRIVPLDPLNATGSSIGLQASADWSLNPPVGGFHPMNDQILFTIRPVEERDRGWLPGYITTLWGDDFVVVHEDLFFPHQLPGYIASTAGDQVIGLATYQIRGSTCEIITLNSLVENQGVGSKLIEAVLQAAGNSGCRRLCLTTTNDNQRAIEFYQNRGFRLQEVRKGAVDQAREIKPSIPEFSPEGVPLSDEWVFELPLTPK